MSFTLLLITEIPNATQVAKIDFPFGRRAKPSLIRINSKISNSLILDKFLLGKDW